MAQPENNPINYTAHAGTRVFVPGKAAVIVSLVPQSGTVSHFPPNSQCDRPVCTFSRTFENESYLCYWGYVLSLTKRTVFRLFLRLWNLERNGVAWLFVGPGFSSVLRTLNGQRQKSLPCYVRLTVFFRQSRGGSPAQGSVTFIQFAQHLYAWTGVLTICAGHFRAGRNGRNWCRCRCHTVIINPRINIKFFIRMRALLLRYPSTVCRRRPAETAVGCRNVEPEKGSD